MLNIQTILRIFACASIFITQAACFDYEATLKDEATLLAFLERNDDPDPAYRIFRVIPAEEQT